MRQLADHHGQSPDRLCEQQVRDYFLFLKNEKKFAPASLKMAFYGIRHFYMSELFFDGSDWANDPRHVDPMWTLWNVLDLTPEGRGDWYPAVTYDS